MHTLSVVVEGRTDADLLRKVLPREDLAGLRFFAAQGRISLSTVARNILVHEGESVLVVMDADTLNRDAAEESRQIVKAAVSHVAAHVPLEVFSFVPEIEVVFFEAPDYLAKRLGRELGQAEILQGLASPKRMITALMNQTGLDLGLTSLFAHNDEKATADLRQGTQLAALIGVLRSLVADARESACLVRG